MKSKEISKILAVTITATTIVNPYVAVAESGSRAQMGANNQVIESVNNENEDVNTDSEIGDINTDSSTGDVNTDSETGDLNTDPATGDVNTDSETEDVNTDSETGDLNTDPATGDVNTDSEVGDINTDSEAGDVNTDSATGDVNTDSEIEDVTEVNNAVSDKYIYLSDIDYVSSKSNVGYGKIMKDKNVDGGKIKLLVDGEALSFDKGMSAHATSNIVYDVSNLSNKYTRFSAYLGVDYSHAGQGNGVKFKILTSQDGNNWTEIKNTGVITPGSNSEYIDVDITGAKYIKLYANDNGANAHDHAVYADARLLSSDYSIYDEDVLVGLLKVSGYDKILSSRPVEYNIKNNQQMILQRTFVNRVGYNTIQRLYRANEVNKNGIDFLMQNKQAMEFFIANGEATIGGDYSKSLEALCKIYDKYKTELEDSKDNYFNLRLATSIALAYSKSELVRFWVLSNSPIDPVKRYEVYQNLIESKIFDEGGDTSNYGKWSTEQFKALPIPLMKWVVDVRMNDDEIRWLADYALSKKKANSKFDYLDAYNYINYTFDYNYDRDIYYDKDNYDKFNNKYNFGKYYSNFGDKNIKRLWMVFEEGSVCGGLAKTYANLSEVLGRPSSVVGQPGHAATITYGWNTSSKQYEWIFQNNISGWQGSGNEYSDRMLNWGNDKWCTGYSASYVALSTDAIETKQAYNNFIQATYLNLLAESYSDLNTKESIYRQALDIQNINLDSFEGLINTFKANKEKTSADYRELAEKIISAYTYYPLPMADLLKYMSSGLTDDNDILIVDMLKTNALNKAKVATPSDVKQPNIAKDMANSLISNSVELASFSFDGNNANSIVVNSKYDNTAATFKYSLDGGVTWKETTDHIIKLSDAEVNSINDTNDIKVSVSGSNEIYTIDIKKGENISTSFLTINNLSNTIEGKISNLQFSTDNGENWCDYTQDITFPGEQEVLVRYKAFGTNLQGSTYKFNFKSDKYTDNRKYIRAKHLTLIDFSSQNGTSSNYAAAGMVDENPLTLWHTKFDIFDKDKFLTIKLDKSRYISALEYQPANVNGRFKSVEVYTSLDGENWTLATEVKNMANSEYQKQINFPESVLSNYVKIVATETYGNYAEEVNKYASGKGIYLFEDTTKTNTEDVSEDTNKNNTGNISEDTDKNNTEDVNEDTTKDNTEDVNEDTNKDNTGDISEDTDKNNTEDVNEDTTKDNTEDVNEDTDKNNTEDVNEDIDKNNTENVNIEYSTVNQTSDSVTASLKLPKNFEAVAESEHTFTENSAFLFRYKDSEGIEHEIEAKVDWIVPKSETIDTENKNSDNKDISLIDKISLKVKNIFNQSNK